MKERDLSIENPDLTLTIDRVEKIFPGGISTELRRLIEVYLETYHADIALFKDRFTRDPTMPIVPSVYEIADEGTARELCAYINKDVNAVQMTLWQALRFYEKYPNYVSRKKSALSLCFFYDLLLDETLLFIAERTSKGLSASCYQLHGRIFKAPRIVTPLIGTLVKKVA